MGKKRPRRNHKTTYQPPHPRGSRAERTPLDELPPVPKRLAVPPDAAELAADGFATLPVLTDGPAAGWGLVDRLGRQTEMLVLLAEEPSREDLVELGSFELHRHRLGDPQFADWTPEGRIDQARALPSGETRVLHIAYGYDEPLPDGSQSVLVEAQGNFDAWLVLDAAGELLDGARLPRDGDDEPELVVARWTAFILRRVDAGDPRVRVEYRSKTAAGN